ncbi:MAG: zf-HC2 domain-containing protein [Elusimicrobiota bacterium]|nr:MAG: zf-HC2 domain-containing protein [Elusimicrobiota bacterium]
MHLNQCLLYDSGELSGAEAAEFERHLAVCAECRGLLDAAESAHRWARGAGIAPSPSLAAAAMAAAGPFPLAARAGAAAYALAGLLFVLTLARGLAPVGDREELERLGAELERLKEPIHE